MKSLSRSTILITSLAANAVLAAFVLVHFLGARVELPAPAARDVAPPRAAESAPGAPRAAAVPQTPEAVSASLPAPAAPPIAPSSVSAPPVFPVPPAAPAAAPSLSVPPQGTRSLVSSGIPSGSSSQAPQPAPDEDATLGTASPVNSSAPGNSFVSRGVRVAVAETYPMARGGGTPLGIDLSPTGEGAAETSSDGSSEKASSVSGSGADNAGDNGNSQTTTTRTASAAAASPTPTAGESRASDKSGFTEDEELFRMKWGWAAYDAAQSEAKHAAENKKAR